jgi:OOP family OmpA-OmpF porin
MVMKYLRTLAACVLVPTFMSGCASTSSGDLNYCVIGGAVAGAAAGIAVDGELIGGLLGAGAGAVMGGVMCRPDEEKPMMVMDADGDGVPDDKDACPGTPPDVIIDGKGCPFDDDMDGVPDFLDLCPDTPKGARVNFNGCPYDSDGDGVADGLDKCPGTPKGEAVDAMGCPNAEPVSIVTNINFDFDSAAIRADSKAKLDSVIAIMKDNPKVQVRVVGHTDSTGTEEYNVKLSERRAESVRKYMTANGVALDRLTIAGKGEAEPLVSNRTKAGRAVNRRVEFEAR